MKPGIQIISLFKTRTADLIYIECKETVRLNSEHNIEIKTTSTPDFFTNFTHGDLIRVIGDNLLNEFGDGYYIIEHIEVEHYKNTKSIFTIYGKSIFSILKNVFLKNVNFRKGTKLRDIFIEIQTTSRHHRDFNNLNSKNMDGTDSKVSFDYFTVTTDPYNDLLGMTSKTYESGRIEENIEHDYIDMYSLIYEICNKSDTIIDNIAVQIKNKENSFNKQKINIIFRIASNDETKKTKLIMGKHYNKAITQTDSETPVTWLRPTGKYIDSDPLHDFYEYTNIMYPFNNQGYFGNSYYNKPSIPIVNEIDIDSDKKEDVRKYKLIFNTSIDLLPTKKNVRLGERVTFGYQQGTTEDGLQQVVGVDVDYMTGEKTILIGKNDTTKYSI